MDSVWACLLSLVEDLEVSGAPSLVEVNFMAARILTDILFLDSAKGCVKDLGLGRTSEGR